MNRPISGRHVDVVVRVPRLAVDRPFTYRLPEGMGAGPGSLVEVPFHGRTVQAWVIGDAAEIPPRVSQVRRAVSAIRFFDERLVALARALSHRYLIPLSVVIDRAIPPRTVSEENVPAGPPAPVPTTFPAGRLDVYRPGFARTIEATGGAGGYLVRPLPHDESDLLVEAVGRCLLGGRDAIVLVPQAEPVPHAARALAEAFGDAVALFLGGEPRERYRTWLDILGGRYRVVVGTRPAVFAPVHALGLVWVHREAHAGHREERSPSWHVRDVALLRASMEGAVGVAAGLFPSAEALVPGKLFVARAARSEEQRAWPIVEAVKPGPEGRAPRILQGVRDAGSGFLMASRPGYGVARVCRSCKEPAACARCEGALEQHKGVVRCAVCGAEGVCANCGARDFGVQRRGAERVAEWAARVASVTVREADGPPDGRGITVGTPASVPDAGPRELDLVGVLDADRMLRRPGLSGAERVVATWFEAAAWARPRPSGRVIIETAEPGDPAVQALVRNEPWLFMRADSERRAAAGFPPGYPVFRVVGTAEMAAGIAELAPVNLLVSEAGDERVCLVTVSPDALDAFVARIREWARSGEVRRVEAEPHL